ncbi:MAG: 50S ribosomal protein L35 [Planctomycetes bacterium]|nr:50S ribosomal protein L35 [Planctomycetota bacterium]
MPKLKPCKAMRSRVRVTKNGKVVSKSCGTVHRRVVKSPKKRRQLKRIRVLDNTAAKKVRKLLCL